MSHSRVSPRLQEGYTALHLAAASGSANGAEALPGATAGAEGAVQALLCAGAPVTATASSDAATVLHSAAVGGNVALVKTLLQAGGDPCARNKARSVGTF